MLALALLLAIPGPVYYEELMQIYPKPIAYFKQVSAMATKATVQILTFIPVYVLSGIARAPPYRHSRGMLVLRSVARSVWPMFHAAAGFRRLAPLIALHITTLGVSSTARILAPSATCLFWNVGFSSA